MPIKNVTTAGTPEALVTVTATGGGALSGIPSTHLCNAVTLEYKPANTGKIYVGLPVPLGRGSAVSSTNYDVYLDSTISSYTIGLADGALNSVDLANVYLDVQTNGEGISYAPEQV